MSPETMIKESYSFPNSPSDSTGSDDGQVVDGARDRKGNEPRDGYHSDMDAAKDAFLHTPTNEIRTLSPQSEQSLPPQTPQKTTTTMMMNPLLQRGRVLTAEEVVGGTNSDHYPAIVHGSPIRDYSMTNLATTPTSNNSYMRFQNMTSPSTAIQQNRFMTQQLQQQANISDVPTFGDSPNSNLINSMGTNHTMPVSMLWGSEMGGVRHPGEKPKRPLSAYNFYFQLERERIINCEEEERDRNVQYSVEDVARLTMIQQRKAKENKPKEKRSHRKTHGKISFGDLARTIANKWKRMDKANKEIFDGSAAIEKERYRKELAEWNKQMKKWKDAASKMTSSLNFSNGLNTSSSHTVNSMTTASYNGTNHVVTPDQIPKRTVYSNLDGDVVSSPTTQMMNAIANHQKRMKMSNSNNNNNDGNVSLSGRSTSSSAHKMVQQQTNMHPTSSGNRAAAINDVLLQQRAGLLPSNATLGSQLQGFRGSVSGNINGMGLNQGSNHNAFDYTDDLGNPYGMNDGMEDDFYMNDALSHVSGGNPNRFDYDDVTDETYRMAQMMLPPQRTMTGNIGGGGGSLQQQQRRMVNQRRMKMLMIMQQRYKRQQQMMMQMNSNFHAFNGVNQGLMDQGLYDSTLDDPLAYADQLDDATSYMDQSSAAYMMNQGNTAAAAAAAAALVGGTGVLNRPHHQQQQQQLHHRQMLQQQQQQQQRNRLLDEMHGSNHSVLNDEYYNNMQHILHEENFEDRS